MCFNEDNDSQEKMVAFVCVPVALLKVTVSELLKTAH